MPLTKITERVARLEAQHQALVEGRVDRDREIKRIRTDLETMIDKLDLLLTDKTERDTAIKIGRWLIAGVAGLAVLLLIYREMSAHPVAQSLLTPERNHPCLISQHSSSFWRWLPVQRPTSRGAAAPGPAHCRPLQRLTTTNPGATSAKPRRSEMPDDPPKPPKNAKPLPKPKPNQKPQK